MGIFDGCVLLSDIDGTLLTKGVIPEKNLEAIKWFKSEGGIFSVATGRTVNAIINSYDFSFSNAPIVAAHGGVIYNPSKDKVEHMETLKPEVFEIVYDILDKFKDIGCELCEEKGNYELRSTKDTKWHGEYEHFEFLELPDDLNSINITKILFATPDEKTLLELEKYSNKFKTNYCRLIATCNNEKAHYFEILPIESNKGSALKRLKELYNCKYSFGIGDFFNDVELIKEADFGAAVEGAPEEIIKIANYVTCRCEDGAVADFIKQISCFLERK